MSYTKSVLIIAILCMRECVFFIQIWLCDVRFLVCLYLTLYWCEYCWAVVHEVIFWFTYCRKPRVRKRIAEDLLISPICINICLFMDLMFFHYYIHFCTPQLWPVIEAWENEYNHLFVFLCKHHRNCITRYFNTLSAERKTRKTSYPLTCTSIWEMTLGLCPHQ